MRIVRSLMMLLVVVLSVAGVGCKDEPSSSADGTGGVSIVASTEALQAAKIAAIHINVSSVSPAYSSTFSLAKDGATWSGEIDHLEPASYIFDASAVDENDAELFHATESGIKVTAGEVAAVTLSFRALTPPAGFYNTAPYIVSITATKATVDVNETITITVGASDPENQNQLTYEWSTDIGSITGPGDSATFTAPSTPGTATVTVKVNDNNGAISVGRITIQVVDLSAPADATKGGVKLQAEFSEPPNVTAMTVSNGQPNVGDTVTVTASVEGGTFHDCDESQGDDCSVPTATVAWEIDCATVGYESSGWYGAGTFSYTFTVKPTNAVSCDVKVTLVDFWQATNYGITRIALTQPTASYVAPPSSATSVAFDTTSDIAVYGHLTNGVASCTQSRDMTLRYKTNSATFRTLTTESDGTFILLPGRDVPPGGLVIDVAASGDCGAGTAEIAQDVASVTGAQFGDDFSGKVTSTVAACSANRHVSIYEDSDPDNLSFVGSNDADASGNWTLVGAGGSYEARTDRFFVSVGGVPVCCGDLVSSPWQGTDP